MLEFYAGFVIAYLLIGIIATGLFIRVSGDDITIGDSGYISLAENTLAVIMWLPLSIIAFSFAFVFSIGWVVKKIGGIK